MPGADDERARRAAQRRLAREIKTGTYKPSGVGAKARRVATERVTRQRSELSRVRDLAFYNINRRLGDYLYFKRETVEANVYGGRTSESGDVPGMDFEQAEWSAHADEEELRSRAESQYRGNPWFYH